MTIPLFEFIEWRSLDDDMIQKDYPSTKKNPKRLSINKKNPKRLLHYLYIGIWKLDRITIYNYNFDKLHPEVSIKLQ
jgi:hypothetical protein